MNKETLCGTEFEVVTGKRKQGDIINHFIRARRNNWYSLNKVYGRCSEAKWSIWEMWERKIREIADSLDTYPVMFVASAGTSYFTISAQIGADVYLITPSHNYIVKGVMA